MVTDYTEHRLANTIAIVNACIKAGCSERIEPFLRDYRSAAGVEAELAAEAARPPVAARAPAAAHSSAASTNDALRVAIEKRFRAQNGRAG